jgi:hypothetical protein
MNFAFVSNVRRVQFAPHFKVASVHDANRSPMDVIKTKQTPISTV